MRNAATASSEITSNMNRTATPRFTFQSIASVPRTERQIWLRFKVKKKNGALSVTGASLYAYCLENEVGALLLMRSVKALGIGCEGEYESLRSEYSPR